MSLAELKLKEVVNVQTGSKLGRVMDIEFSMETGQVTALVVPGEFNVVNFVRGERAGVIIPWNLIIKVGDDVILIRIDESCPVQ